jgi:hypothetical protein
MRRQGEVSGIAQVSRSTGRGDQYYSECVTVRPDKARVRRRDASCKLSAQAMGRRDARDKEADREAGAGARALAGLVARRTTKSSFFALFLIDDEVRWAPNNSTVVRVVAVLPIQRALPGH